MTIWVRVVRSKTQILGLAKGLNTNFTKTVNNLKFDDRGRVAKYKTITQEESFGIPGKTILEESLQDIRYNRLGQMLETSIMVHEEGISERGVIETPYGDMDVGSLDRNWTVDSKFTKYARDGRVLRALQITKESGKTTWKEDVEDRVYNVNGKVFSSSEKISEIGRDYRRVYEVSHRSNLYNGLGQVIHNIKTTKDWDKTVTESTIDAIEYDSIGRMVRSNIKVHEKSLVLGLDRRFEQVVNITSYNNLSQAQKQITTVQKDSRAPSLISTVKQIRMKYDLLGRIVAYLRTSQSNSAPLVIQVSERKWTKFNDLGQSVQNEENQGTIRAANTFDPQVWKGFGEGYNYINSIVKDSKYDRLGRLIFSLESRHWNYTGGGNIAGLDSDWEQASVEVESYFNYVQNSNRIKTESMRVKGHGKHNDKAIEERGIDFGSIKGDIRYDNQGREIGSWNFSAQWTQYDYSYIHKGKLVKKEESKSGVLGRIAIFTQNIVLAFDGFGRVAASASRFVRDDGNRTTGSEKISNIQYNSDGTRATANIESVTAINRPKAAGIPVHGWVAENWLGDLKGNERAVGIEGHYRGLQTNDNRKVVMKKANQVYQYDSQGNLDRLATEAASFSMTRILQDEGQGKTILSQVTDYSFTAMKMVSSLLTVVIPLFAVVTFGLTLLHQSIYKRNLRNTWIDAGLQLAIDLSIAGMAKLIHFVGGVKTAKEFAELLPRTKFIMNGLKISFAAGIHAGASAIKKESTEQILVNAGIGGIGAALKSKFGELKKTVHILWNKIGAISLNLGKQALLGMRKVEQFVSVAIVSFVASSGLTKSFGKILKNMQPIINSIIPQIITRKQDASGVVIYRGPGAKPVSKQVSNREKENAKKNKSRMVFYGALMDSVMLEGMFTEKNNRENIMKKKIEKSGPKDTLQQQTMFTPLNVSNYGDFEHKGFFKRVMSSLENYFKKVQDNIKHIFVERINNIYSDTESRINKYWTHNDSIVRKQNFEGISVSDGSLIPVEYSKDRFGKYKRSRIVLEKLAGKTVSVSRPIDLGDGQKIITGKFSVTEMGEIKPHNKLIHQKMNKSYIVLEYEGQKINFAVNLNADRNNFEYFLKNINFNVYGLLKTFKINGENGLKFTGKISGNDVFIDQGGVKTRISNESLYSEEALIYVSQNGKILIGGNFFGTADLSHLSEAFRKDTLLNTSNRESFNLSSPHQLNKVIIRMENASLAGYGLHHLKNGNIGSFNDIQFKLDGVTIKTNDAEFSQGNSKGWFYFNESGLLIPHLSAMYSRDAKGNTMVSLFSLDKETEINSRHQFNMKHPAPMYKAFNIIIDKKSGRVRIVDIAGNSLVPQKGLENDHIIQTLDHREYRIPWLTKKEVVNHSGIKYGHIWNQLKNKLEYTAFSGLKRLNQSVRNNVFPILGWFMSNENNKKFKAVSHKINRVIENELNKNLIGQSLLSQARIGEGLWFTSISVVSELGTDLAKIPGLLYGIGSEAKYESMKSKSFGIFMDRVEGMINLASWLPLARSSLKPISLKILARSARKTVMKMFYTTAVFKSLKLAHVWNRESTFNEKIVNTVLAVLPGGRALFNYSGINSGFRAVKAIQNSLSYSLSTITSISLLNYKDNIPMPELGQSMDHNIKVNNMEPGMNSGNTSRFHNDNGFSLGRKMESILSHQDMKRTNFNLNQTYFRFLLPSMFGILPFSPVTLLI